jgi:hypothetical protein
MYQRLLAGRVMVSAKDHGMNRYWWNCWSSLIKLSYHKNLHLRNKLNTYFADLRMKLSLLLQDMGYYRRVITFTLWQNQYLSIVWEQHGWWCKMTAGAPYLLTPMRMTQKCFKHLFQNRFESKL